MDTLKHIHNYTFKEFANSVMNYSRREIAKAKMTLGPA